MAAIAGPAAATGAGYDSARELEELEDRVEDLESGQIV